MATRALFRFLRQSLPFLTTAALATVLTDLAPAGEPSRQVMTATYQGLTQRADTPAASFRYRYDGRDQWIGRFVGQTLVTASPTAVAGALNWSISSAPAPTGIKPDFRTYCAEVPVAVVPGSIYHFEIQPIDEPDVYGLDDNEKNREAARRRAGYLRELYGRHYLTVPDDPKANSAFQIAVWEIIHEAELPDDPEAPFSLFGGTFRSEVEADLAPAHVNQAQDYLESLTGSDVSFRENPRLSDSELVRLKGIPSPLAGGAVAQSQLVLRVTSGGGGGATVGFGSRGSGGLPGIMTLGFGAPLNGGGGALDTGAFGNLLLSNDSLMSIPGPVGPAQSPVPAFPGLPVNPVDRFPGENPSVFNPPTSSPADVPAPPTLVLVLIAVGVLAARRGLHRPLLRSGRHRACADAARMV